jgi:CheY-like chemotaxis protein
MEKTSVADLVRNTASGVYYARVRIKGKLIWKSLKADNLSVAKLRLRDFFKKENKRVEITGAAERRKMTFGDALVISDIGLPDDTGYELMSKLRNDFGLKGIALTGYGMEDDMTKNQNAEFAGHLFKPILIEALEFFLLEMGGSIVW